MRKLPDFRYEKDVWRCGFNYVAGIDEVGRGAFAGPVVAGCVVFAKQSAKINISQGQSLRSIKIDDSKRLTAKQRNIAGVWIKENCLTWGIGEVSAREIDRNGIVKATRKAMRKSIGNANQRLHNRIQYLLIDAFYLPYLKGIRMPRKYQRRNKELKKGRINNNLAIQPPFASSFGWAGQFNNYSLGQQTAIVKGDQKSFSIASASIIAKVYRDNLMIKLSKMKKYKKYKWEKNKGYGTLSHRKYIKKYGFTHLHRKSFVKNRSPITSH